MPKSRTRLWEQLTRLTPLCSGSLHEQYLTCGKAACRCHAEKEPQLHGPYHLWVRHIAGKQVNRTLRPGPDLERVRQGIGNYHRFQQLLGELMVAEEEQVLGGERGVSLEGKKNFKRRFLKRSKDI